MRNFVFLLIVKYYKADQTKEDDVGGECSTHGRRQKCTGFWWEFLKESDHLEDRGVDGLI
jgi:hypothetical protein